MAVNRAVVGILLGQGNRVVRLSRFRGLAGGERRLGKLAGGQQGGRAGRGAAAARKQEREPADGEQCPPLCVSDSHQHPHPECPAPRHSRTDRRELPGEPHGCLPDQPQVVEHFEPEVGYGPADVGLRRHRHRGRPQRPDRGGGHGPGRAAGPLPGEEPLHRGDGRRPPSWPAATASSWPGRSSSPSRTRSTTTSASPPAPSTSPRCSRPASVPSGEPPILLYSDPDRLLDAPERDPRPRRRAWAWPRWRPGPRPRPGPSGASTCASRPSRSTRCGPAPPTRRSARPSAPPCSAASWTSSTASSPTAQKHAQVRSMLAFLAVNSTYRGPYSPGSALCLAFALASPGRRHHVQGAGRHRHHVRPPAGAVRGARRRAAPPRQGRQDRHRRRAGSTAWRWPTARWSPPRSWCPTSTRPPPSPSCSTATSCPTPSSGGSRPSTTGPPTSRCTSPSTGCPSTPAPTRSSTRATSATT